MAGISKKWIFALAALSVLFSCVKEKAIEEPVDNAPERFAEYDPVVRFGLETFMGEDPVTKTTYAGDGQTVLFESKRYERINWNVWTSSTTDKANKPDTVRVLAVDAFTKNGKTQADYSPWEIPGFTNMPDSKDSPADAKPVPVGDDEYNLYWAQSTDARYFYAVYPSPTGRPATYKPAMTVSGPDGSHKVTVTGSIPREQPYVKLDNSVSGVWEYMPNMADAYMYAAAKIPSADAGYVKVPLRFKPLFSAIKLIVTASDAGAKNYRLKRVDLRTDLFYDDLNQGDPNRVNASEDGTALNGDFTATFSTTLDKGDNEPEYTGDFTVTTHTGKDPATRDTTNKRLTIRIPEHERVWLGDDTVKLTFLALPIKQEVMTVVYTFEKKDDGGNLVLGDDGKPLEVQRYLCLQQKTTKADNTGTHNEFSDNGWFKLSAASKLYVKSVVPEIQYYFDVIVQGDLPRTWKEVSPKPAPKTGESFPAKDFFEAKDFYAVISYRDSSGFKQPLRWKVTGYRPEGESSFYPTKPASVSWLNLRGDGPWKMLAPFDVDDAKHPGHPYTDTGYSFDPWDVVQGQGTKMKNPVDKDKNPVLEGSRALVGYLDFDTKFYNFYDAGAPNNGARSWFWVNHGSYIHSTPDGEFVHHDNDGVAFPDSTGLKGWKGVNGEAYAFDLSSHDIYGKLYDGLKNGDLGTTANCYVVSSPGWYRFPAVYGNAIKYDNVIKSGVDNHKAYNKGVPHTTDGIMGAYLDHDDQEITDPWIPYSIKSVEVVWDDANRMVSEREHAATRMDRRPFCETIDGKQYIYFYVDDIAQGNALIAAKDASGPSGTIVWSWHIWAVTNPEESLATIELESNQTVLDPYTPLSNDQYSDPVYPGRSIGWNILLSGYNYSAYPTAAQAPLEFPFAKKSSVKNIFWRRADLGQNGKETGAVDPRYCDVEFTQYFKGKVVAKVVRRFLQSGVEDQYSITPVYQWGRKDPMRTPKTSPVELTNADIGTQRTGRTIQCPEEFYYGDAAIPFTGIRYDNLWNNNITSALYDTRCDDERNQFPGASKDRNVAKTIYDPSPAGFVMPNMYAFSAFNPYGTINQTRFPGQRIDEIAYDAASTYKTDGTGYIDFYAKYDASADYKRLKDPNQTIRIFVSGRLKGTDNSAARANPELLYLWTSEPAVWNGYYGRSFCTQNALGTGAWGLNPVTGVSSSEPDPTAPGSPLPCVRTNGSQPKWQRSHAEPVRPMLEQP